MKKVAHFAVAVKNIEKAKNLYETLLDTLPSKDFELSERGLRVIFFESENLKIELLSPLKKDSEISKFLEKRGEGIHHIAFYVDDIEKEIENLTDEGVLPAGSPQKDADGKKVLFLHPKTTGGVLIELIEK